jgi:hypothetical protein
MKSFTCALCLLVSSAAASLLGHDLAADLSLIDQSKVAMTATPGLLNEKDRGTPDALNLTSSWVYYSQCDSRVPDVFKTL